MKYLFKKIAVLSIFSIIPIALAGSLSFASVDMLAWEDLSDKDMSPIGRAALSMDKDKWKHAETEHFIYHFTDEKGSETVYFHAEAYYKWIKDFFGIKKDSWVKKNQVFIFTGEDMWQDFLARVNKPHGPGAFTTGWELFIYRRPYWASPRYSLAHELTHVIVFRFLEGPIPLFLDEGFASFAASQLLKMQLEQSDYDHRPLKLLSEKEYVPLSQIAAMERYPDEREVFYREGEWFVRFLVFTYGQPRFYEFMRAIAKGGAFRYSIEHVYEDDLDSIEKKFISYSLSG